MPYKQFSLDNDTPVKIYKRKTSRSLKLTIAPGGEVKVSIPTWTPYRVGLEFARSRQEWIERKRVPSGLLQDGQAIGKAHRLRLMPSAEAARVTGRVKQTEIVITYPMIYHASDPAVQAAATKAGIRALRRQAETLLPQRLQQLADRYGFRYRAVTIKQLKGRWGSCDQSTNIVLNLFLMQLPWECIDYVLLHELTHTEILKHGPIFWERMAEFVPNLKSVRKTMRGYQPFLSAPSA